MWVSFIFKNTLIHIHIHTYIWIAHTNRTPFRSNPNIFISITYIHAFGSCTSIAHLFVYISIYVYQIPHTIIHPTLCTWIVYVCIHKRRSVRVCAHERRSLLCAHERRSIFVHMNRVCMCTLPLCAKAHVRVHMNRVCMYTRTFFLFAFAIFRLYLNTLMLVFTYMHTYMHTSRICSSLSSWIV